MPKREITPEDEFQSQQGRDRMSYAEMAVTSRRQALTGVRGWVNVLAVLFVVLLCIGVNFACVGMYYGWDNLFIMLGWKK